MGLELEADVGMKFEVITKHDLVNALHELNRDKSEVIWEGNNFQTDASGNCNAFVYSIPVGKKLLLQRLIVWADGATNPHTPSTLGWWALLAEGPNFMVGNILEYAPQPQQTTVLPFINDYGYHDAPIWHGGSDMYFYGSTLVVSTNISVNFQGLLVPENESNLYPVGPLAKDDNNDPSRRGRRGR